ncbi:MAG TPA: condensation domain-containing protein, partial [Pyrinomonadaceae bacterium]|nr:condensation domain-containing protein [Pyrinomonadaceae bacterium]
PVTNPPVVGNSQNLAYVIYTSGSTGNPKGVMVQQASVINLHEALAQSVYAHHTSEPLRVSLNAPLSFDSSVKQWLQLLRGHTVCVIPEDVRRDGQELLAYLTRQRIDVLDCTPSQLWLLLEAGLLDHDQTRPSLVLLGGEAIESSTWDLLASCSGRRFFNVYGPTECTVDATACHCGTETQSPSIGRPLANVQVYLLDERRELAPIGMAAEVHIGGAGLARGYLARPDLTAEKFIPNPYSSKSGERLYCTGDFARYLPGGQIEFIGRRDHQVKIRGSRIELGEIETTLEQHAAVRRAAVVVHDDSPGDQRLDAYVVPSSEHKISIGDLRTFLQTRLPAYMMPATFMVLDALPLTRNGKVDRKALPAPEPIGSEMDHAFVAPRTPVEEMLAGIWSTVLVRDQVGRHDNFFQLGGHSLLATQAVSRLRKAFQVELPLRALFEAPTIAALAPAVEAARHGNADRAWSSIEPINRDQKLSLSFAQQRLWFLDQLEPDNTAYLIPAAVSLKGILDVPALERTLREVVQRHETLRTGFAIVDGQPVQIIAATLEMPLPLLDLQEFSEDERKLRLWRAIEEETQESFDLSRGPLMRASLLCLGPDEHVLLLTLHHIIFDAWSIEVLLREVAQHYEAFAAGELPKLAELPVQYADYAHWQREWLQGDVLAQQVSYWRQQLKGVATLELPTDRPRPPVQTFKGKHQSFSLPEELRRSLSDLSRRENVTLFMTLLAAFQTMLYRYTAQEDIAVGTPIANRSRSEIEDLIGFFLNTLVMRTDFSGDPRFVELLQRVRETALAAYAHQDVPFEKLVEELQPERDTSHTPFFQVMFALRSVSQKDMQLSELTMSLLEIERGTAKFDLLLMIDETEQGLRAEFEYNTDLFDDATIARMGAHFLKLLESIVTDPAQRVSCLPMLTALERKQLLAEWNATQRPTSHAQCIQQLFEEQAERTLHRVALVYEDEQLTYRQLNERANQLAHYLRSLGVGPDTFVAIMMNRSVEMMVSVLGVLKAGGAYVALDPTYPKERLAFMLEDTRASVVLTQKHLAPSLPASGARVIFYDAERKALSTRPRQNPGRQVVPENLIYVTYTSGSTGKPKGIAMTHGALLNLINWQLLETRLPDGARTLQFASLSFDVSFQDMFSTWA